MVTALEYHSFLTLCLRSNRWTHVLSGTLDIWVINKCLCVWRTLRPFASSPLFSWLFASCQQCERRWQVQVQRRWPWRRPLVSMSTCVFVLCMFVSLCLCECRWLWSLSLSFIDFAFIHWPNYACTNIFTLLLPHLKLVSVFGTSYFAHQIFLKVVSRTLQFFHLKVQCPNTISSLSLSLSLEFSEC